MSIRQLQDLERLRNIDRRKIYKAPSLGQQSNECGYRYPRQMLTPFGRPRKLYSDVVKDDKVEKRYKLKVRSTANHSGEEIRNIIKTNVNPTSRKLGISAFRTLRDGRVLLETKSKDKLELLHTNFQNKCTQVLETKIQKLRNPTILI
jgi:hypothetical protein